ncbi:MAG: hypothetical protein ILP19_03150 [Oscillospiraceae bacterium]|nr:hypothetical protein [Oscillospiraceae bacterium]
MKKVLFLTVQLAVCTMLAGCGAVGAADSPSAAETTVTFVTQTKSPSGYDFFAWGVYNVKKEKLTIECYDEAEDSSLRFIDKNDGDRVLEAESSEDLGTVVKYYFSLDKKKASDEMVFVAERILPDGTSDVCEIIMHKNEQGGYTDIDRKLDGDGDGLEDIEEIYKGTDRFTADTDGDGLPDGYELRELHTDPLKKRSDYYLKERGMDDGEVDIERDGLTNLEEYQSGTNPFDGDSDNDGFPDGYEVKNGMDPLSHDTIVPDKERLAHRKDLSDEELSDTGLSMYGLEISRNEYGKVSAINGAFTDYKMENALDAMYMIYSVRTLLGIEDPTELEFLKSGIDNSTDYYLFGQVYNGVRVQSGTVMVSKSKVNGYTSISSDYFPEEALAHINTVPTIKEEDLLGIAIANAKYTPEKIHGVELYIFKDYDIYDEDYDPTPFLAYHFTTDQHEGFTVDAHTGEVRKQGNTYVT